MLSVGLCLSHVFAQERIEYSPLAEQVFSHGVELYKDGKFPDASTAFDQVIEMFPQNQRTTAAYVMRAKCLLLLDEPVNAGRTLRSFLSLYPSSAYVPDAQYTMALTFVKIQRYDEAAQWLVDVWRSESAVRRSAVEALDRLIDSHLAIPSIENLLKEAKTGEERAFFWLKIGEKEAATDHAAAAETVLDTLYRNYPGNPFSERIAALRVKLEQRSTVKVGVLLPLLTKSDPSAVKEIGNDIYEGIQFAVDEYTAGGGRVLVTMETRDTERDILVAGRIAQELASDKDIVAIFGPVFSNEASTVAPFANRRGCPLISPTANGNGIAAVGPYIFQANPDYETRGRAMARFAVEKLGYHVLAVLAPVNSFGKFMGEAFAAEAIRLGATVVAIEWYERGAADLKSQMASIRRAGLRAGTEPMISFAGRMSREDVARFVQLGVPMKTVDSLMDKGARVGATTLLGPNARHMIDSLGIPATYDESDVDSLEYPVTAIQGVYIPISSASEIGIVSSQLVYYNIQAQVLGSGEWNSLSELDANKRYCSSVVFESDSYIDPADSLHGRFVDSFFQRYKKKPSKNTLYGYDTAEMLLSTIRSVGNSREALAAALQQVKDYRGLHGRIGFSVKRVNSWVWVLRYAQERIHMVDGFYVE